VENPLKLLSQPNRHPNPTADCLVSILLTALLPPRGVHARAATTPFLYMLPQFTFPANPNHPVVPVRKLFTGEGSCPALDPVHSLISVSKVAHFSDELPDVFSATWSRSPRHLQAIVLTFWTTVLLGGSVSPSDPDLGGTMFFFCASGEDQPYIKKLAFRHPRIPLTPVQIL
jgi:hypothetical protein